MCRDCWELSPEFQTGTNWTGEPLANDIIYYTLDIVLDVMGQDDFDAAVLHCNATETDPSKYERFEKDSHAMSGVGYYVLVFVVGLVVLPILGDLEQAAHESRLLKQRLQSIESEERKALIRKVYTFTWLWRVALLPQMIWLATVGLITSGEYSSQNLLLNGLAVGFATQVDDIVAVLVRSRKSTAVVDEALEAFERDREQNLEESEAEEETTSRWNFRYAVWLLFPVLFFTAIFPHWFGEAFLWTNGVNMSPTPSLLASPAYLMAFMVLVVGIALWSYEYRSSLRERPLASLAKGTLYFFGFFCIIFPPLYCILFLPHFA